MFAASKSAKVASVAVSVTDPQINYVTTLLNGDGTNGTQNNTFLDSSANNLTVTRYGNATQGSQAPFGANWSNYFNGSTDYFTTPSSDVFAFGTGDFTVEAWVNIPALPSGYSVLGGTFYTGSSDAYWFFAINSSGYPLISGRFTTLITGTTAIPINTWTHIAISRASGTNSVFVNGALSGTSTTSVNFNGTNTMTVGSAGNAGTFTGYISNFRIVKGTAVYTSNFTPPTAPLTAITNTSLLTCQSSRFKDSSTNAFAITPAGTPSVQRFSPFSPSASYSSSTDGGSIYFDGAGDYLSFPAGASNDFGTGNFTIEMWVNPSSLTTYNMLYAVGTMYLSLKWGATSSVFGLNAYNGVENINSSASTTPINQWTHIAFVRSSGTLYFYINGVASGSGAFSSAVGNSTGTSSLGYNPAYTGLYYTNAYISNFRAVKGTAVYTTGFTPPTAPATAITGTQLLLNGTNAGIYDSSMQTIFETVGNAQISTTQKKFGTGSIYFDGTGDYLVAPYSKAQDLTSGDFTFEAWVYRSVAGAEHNIGVTRSSSGTDGWNLRINSSNTLQFYFTGGSSLTSTGTIPATTWTHVAATRSGTTLRLFINGVIDGSTTVSDGTTNTQLFRVGVANDNTTGYMNGYIDDLRITKGYARYTANFTPPTAALPTS